MCLVVFAWQTHPQYRLILAANRDEFHRRPTQSAHWWLDNESFLAGRDLQAGGTWLAMSKSGRFATVTNFHEGQKNKARFESRGTLVSSFVAGSQSLSEFASSIVMRDYAGFSLLLSDGESMLYLSNRDDLQTNLEPQIYGLSNASLDTPWSKVVRTKANLTSLIENNAINETELTKLLYDRTLAVIDNVVSEDLPFEIPKTLSSPFIVSPNYGTRSSTTILWRTDGVVEFCERSFNPSGKADRDSRFSFIVE